MLEKATQGTPEKPELRTTVELSAAFTVWHVLSISDVNNGQQQKWHESKSKGTRAGSRLSTEILEKGFSTESWSLHEGSDSMNGRIKNSQNLFLDEIKSRGRSLNKQREKFKYMRACGHHIKTSIYCDGGPCPEKQQQMLFSPGNEQTQPKYHLHFKMQFYLAENMLS